MIFKRLIAAVVGTPEQSSDPFAYGNDPIARVFQGDFSMFDTPDAAEHRERRRKTERAKMKRRIEAINFFTRGLNTLAEAHVKALEEANAAPSRQKLRELNDFIARGHKSLVMQADLLFGPKNVDDALTEIGYNPFDFRRSL